MTGARISFTCDTSDDADIVEWCDSFSSRERGFAIKAAIRLYITEEQKDVQSFSINEFDPNRLTALEDKVSDIFREIVALRKEGLALSINNDIINNDLQNPLDQDNLDPVVESNIGKLFKD